MIDAIALFNLLSPPSTCQFGLRVFHCHTNCRMQFYACRKCLKVTTTYNDCKYSANQDMTVVIHVRGMDDIVVYFDAYSSWRKGHRECKKAYQAVQTQEV